LENGYESLEKFSVDRRHADKWLGPERIAELEQMRLEKEKERREMIGWLTSLTGIIIPYPKKK
jgi:hypothetical protein